MKDALESVWTLVYDLLKIDTHLYIPMYKLMLPCSSRGGYHVGGGIFMACIALTLWLSWGARVSSVASLSQ